MIALVPEPPAQAEATLRPALHPVLLANAIANAKQAREVSRREVRWFWAGILAPTCVAEIAGESGGGKSTCVFTLSVAACAPPGAPVSFLGREVTPIEEGKFAIVVAAENGDVSAVAQVERAIAAFGLDREYVWSRLVLVTRGADPSASASSVDWKQAADDGDVFAAVFETLYSGIVGFLGLDTRAALFGALGYDANGEEQSDLSKLLRRGSERGGCPIALTSHTRKNATAYDVTAVSGSAQRAAGADVVLLLQASREKGRVLSTQITMAKNRDLVDDAGFACSYGFRRDSETQRWTIVLDGEVADGRSPKERVLAVLRDSGAAMTVREVREAAHVSYATAKKLLGELDRAKRVLCLGSTWEFLPDLFDEEGKQ